MAKKPLGPEGARFKKADWNPQATGSKGTYISDRDALEARVAELEKVNGITVETVSLTRGMVDGDGPFIIKFLEPDGSEFEYAALSGNPSAAKAHFASVAKSQIADEEMNVPLITPPLGDMADATVASWLKNPGDYVIEGEPIAVIETDKATIDLEAAISGQMGPHLVQAGDNFKAGESIGSILPPKVDSTAQWPFAGALPPVAVIKSPTGERFISMPIAGTLKHLQADLAKVQLGDDLFSVAISPPYFIRWKQGRELYETTLLKEARAIRAAAQYTPERINALITGGGAVMKERDRLREQIAKLKHRDTNFVPITSQRDFSIIAAAVGWIAAIGLYLYSDLPMPFGGDDSTSAVSGVDNAALQSCVSRIYQAKQNAPQEVVDVSASIDRLPNGVFVITARPGDRNLLRGMRLTDISTAYNYNESSNSASISFRASNPPDNPNGTAQAFFVNFLLLDKDLERCTPLDEKSEYVRFEPRNNRGTFNEGVYGEPIYVGTAREINTGVSFTSGTPEGIPVVTYMAFTVQGEVTR